MFDPLTRKSKELLESIGDKMGVSAWVEVPKCGYAPPIRIFKDDRDDVEISGSMSRCRSVTRAIVDGAGSGLIDGCEACPCEATVVVTIIVVVVVARAPSVVTSFVYIGVAAIVVGIVVIGGTVAITATGLSFIPLAKTTMELRRVVGIDRTIGILATALIGTIFRQMFFAAVKTSYFIEFFEACLLIHFQELFAFKDRMNGTFAEKAFILVFVVAASIAADGRVERSTRLWSRGCFGTGATIAEGFGLFKDGLQQWIGGSHRLLF